MDIKLANEIIACLPRDRTVFDYYDDRYAVVLLQQLAGEGMPIADIKAGRFARLLERPRVKAVVACKGNGVLCSHDLIYAAPETGVERYVLTLGRWGERGDDRSWRQTSRAGTNLVLQLNFSRRHDAVYEKMLKPVRESPFIYWGHPVCRRGRTTMAWARIDLNLATGEALIEEIQNDWIRRALGNYAHARTVRRQYGVYGRYRIMLYNKAEVGTVWKLMRYVETALLDHARWWADAMLAATVWFLVNEIGVTRIWYHDHETGMRLKKIPGARKPPRSLYTDLPRRFCFERVEEGPAFVTDVAPRPFKRRLKQGYEHFWRLDL